MIERSPYYGSRLFSLVTDLPPHYTSVWVRNTPNDGLHYTAFWGRNTPQDKGSRYSHWSLLCLLTIHLSMLGIHLMMFFDFEGDRKH